MTNAFDLLQQHFQTLLADNALWQTFIADDAVWELPFAESLGHPTRLSGRDELIRHAQWFGGAVEDFRFFDLRLYRAADPESAIAEVKAEGRIKATGRIYQQEYIVFLRSRDRKIKLLREYFDPTRAAKAMNVPIRGLDA
ncbi:MAG: ketosteroid isomerase-like protein [Schlesneria sp.]|nr:ketosteroid isomerase-like protein [Schlesneria sp.]